MPVSVTGIVWYQEEDYDRLTLAGQGMLPDTFPTWCAKRGMAMDARARTAYGSECAASRRSGPWVDGEV